MDSRSWRLVLLVFCACCVGINCYSLFTDSVEASSALGFQVARTGNPALVRVTSVDTGGAAERSGLRVGDLIHLRALSAGDRYRILTGVYPHERIGVSVFRDNRDLQVAYQSGGPPVWRWDVWLWCAASFWMLAFAIVIAWRRADLPEARILCMLLALVPGSAALLSGTWLTPSPLADMVAACLGYTLTWISAVLLAKYALLFGRPVSAMRVVLTALAYASAAALSIYETLRLVMAWNGSEAWVAQSVGPDWNFVWGALPYALALLCACVAVRSAQGAQRSRIAWTTATLGILYVLQCAMYVVPLLFPSDQRGSALVAAYQCVNIGGFLAPIGMTYALLNRRLLDTGFALNRVAIFSSVSLIIVGLFVLAEWGLSLWLQDASHTTSLLADAAVALLLGFSIRFVHTRVEHVLDRVFFRKRHEDEQAIRRFARETAYMTDITVLIDRTVRVLTEHADASAVGIALDNGNGHYGNVDENDPAIVSLRTWHRVIDLHGQRSALTGDLAYPMVARGRLVGVLVLGPKTSQEAYAPDESQAIEELAHGVANALDGLTRHASGAEGRVIDELRAVQLAITQGFQDLRAALRHDDSPALDSGEKLADLGA